MIWETKLGEKVESTYLRFVICAISSLRLDLLTCVNIFSGSWHWSRSDKCCGSETWSCWLPFPSPQRRIGSGLQVWLPSRDLENTYTRCCFNVGPPSATLAQHCISTRSMSWACWMKNTVGESAVFDFYQGGFSYMHKIYQMYPGHHDTLTHCWFNVGPAS